MSFKVKGIKFTVTFMFSAMIALFLSLRAPQAVLIAVISSLLHEIGHLSVMLAVGNRPESVRLELGGMNIKRCESVRTSIKSEILIALGGAAVNALIFISCTVAYCLCGGELVLNGACINLILMTFNLLPVKGLDGGMALYYMLSFRYDSDFSSGIIKITSVVFLALIYLWGVYVFVLSGYNISVLMIAVFLTISLFGGSEY